MDGFDSFVSWFLARTGEFYHSKYIQKCPASLEWRTVSDFQDLKVQYSEL